MADTDKTLKTNDLKKHTIVLLTGNRRGMMMDNKRGNIRCIRVFDGMSSEMGDCYAHDILFASIGNEWLPVQLTKAQVDLSRKVATLGVW